MQNPIEVTAESGRCLRSRDRIASLRVVDPNALPDCAKNVLVFEEGLLGQDRV